MRIASKTHNPWIWIAGAVLTVASAISADEAGRNRGSQPLTSTTIAPAQRTVTTPGSFALSLDSDLDLGGFVFKQGYPFLHNEGGSSYGNTALGVNALISATPGTPYSSSGAFNSSFGHNALRNNSTGLTNSALGWMTLYYNTTGYRNTATGADALRRNETGSNNTALGVKALYFNTTASQNTAIGSVALFYNTDGYQNTALGANALLNNETGDRNSAVGEGALKNTTTGSFNTAVGWAAGYSLSTGSNNVFVGRGANGGAADSGTIRIGGSDLQSQTFIEGVSGTNVSGVNVLITAGDQLGVAASSARFKQDIHDLEGVSDQLMDLRPVSFRYKDEYASEGLKSIEYGLIAEEVAEIFPELVVGDANGKPYTVRYQLLTPLLLAEVQRQQDVLDDQRQQLTDLRRRLRLLESKQRFR